MTKSLPKIFSPSAVIVKSDDVSTIFRVNGIPYGGPDYLEGKDLHGQYFDKTKTDYGRNGNGEIEVRTIYSFYDHALNDAIGKDPLGFAKFYQETDDGQLWDIEVMRAYRYHDMLLALAEKNLLGASSQPVQTSVEIDYDSGLIKRWHPAEISLTTTPANPNAVVDIVKSYDMDLAAKIEAAAAAENTEELPNLEDLVGDDASGEIDNLFNDNQDNENTEEVPDGELVTSEAIKSIMDKLDALTAAIAALETKNAEDHRTLAKGISNTTNGLKSFAGHVATKLKMDVQDIVQDNHQKSEQELEAEQDIEEEPIRRMKSGIPANAPGKKN